MSADVLGNDPQAMIGFGFVRHTRLRPKWHHFIYPTYFLMLPMRTLVKMPARAGALAWNRPGLLSFRETDHGDGRTPAQGGALAWIDELLRANGVQDADGEIWLQCYPRVFGYSFKPVSFWYCYRVDGVLAAIVAEVNNTFGERHVYLIEQPRFGEVLLAQKSFHVSPFCQVKGHYRFRFLRSRADDHASVAVSVDYEDDDGPLIKTSLGGRLQLLTRRARARALLRYPWMTLAVIVRIHWHALLLWCKGVPFYSKPQPPSSAVTRHSSHR